MPARASIRQSRADGIPCRSAATDEVLKVPNCGTTDNGQPSGRFRGFGPGSATIPVHEFKKITDHFYPLLMFYGFQNPLASGFFPITPSKRKTVTAMDVVYALKRQGRTLYGFGG
ncbi:Histone H4 [Eumeta japonica]|uniref:Histone H4 n=1 Tax=Eumeta variegata TaxID=151549 RepID=A0A4C1ZWP6_EUMVA|nr:Histone H4 [Eumeta japonica]